jgi:hypothetical protein
MIKMMMRKENRKKKSDASLSLDNNFCLYHTQGDQLEVVSLINERT